MKRYLLNGLAVLAMGLAITSCMKEINSEQQEQQASLDNAQQALGFYIPDNQDWVMTSTATATFNVEGLSDTGATLYVFSNNPYSDGYGSVLASAPMTSTTTTISGFRIPQHYKSVYVGLKQSNGNMVYKYVDVENNQITANYDFSTPAQARTRASAVVEGDPFTFENTNSYYKTVADIPGNAKDINTTSDYDCIMSGKLVATSGMRSNVNLWQGPAVDIYINGNVTMPSSAYIYSANFYVLPGAVLTMDRQANYECAIYVSAGGTLNYNPSKLETNEIWENGQRKDVRSCIYNRGEVNFSTNFEANQDITVYNEGVMNAKDITSKPGDGHPSYFYNFGELNITGTFQLNSCANFYNEGTVTVGGLTECTQGNGQIWWINKGHYTTKQFKIQAWNGTYYNFCQLIVEEDAYLHDGQFNLMTGGYMEAASADCNNFQVNMKGNTGFNIKGDSYWGAQGDGTYQGFMATGENNYVRLGGTTTVASHRYSFQTTGKITIGFNNLVELGAGNSGVWPTVQLNENTTRVDFSELNPTYNSTDCGASWASNPSVETPVTENQTWTYAFEDNKTRCDFDMNDVVIQIRESESDASKLIVTLVAAGCEYDNYVWLGNTRLTWNGNAEVHNALGVAKGTMVNTGSRGVDADAVSTTIDKPVGFDFQNPGLKIRPFHINADPEVESNAITGFIEIIKEGNPSGLAEAPLGIAIPDKWRWPLERVNVTNAYTGFIGWGKQADLTLRAERGGWYQTPEEDYVYSK